MSDVDVDVASPPASVLLSQSVVSQLAACVSGRGAVSWEGGRRNTSRMARDTIS